MSNRSPQGDVLQGTPDLTVMQTLDTLGSSWTPCGDGV
jgi:hypothetical protein